MSNRNILWGQVFVDELARSGLKAVCAAPGSRHTPLMLAFAKHPNIQVYSHLDERSASFFALGLALASDEPVALVCSSGTAGANMYPAIIEAHQSRVPLIVLTADRPHELRHSGANQTIDQIKMFGDFVLWFVDMPLPEANPPAIAIRNLRTTANRAYAKANGLRKGVVHLNFPFRKPLEPTPVEGDMVDIAEKSAGRIVDDLDWEYSIDDIPYSTIFRTNAKFNGGEEIANIIKHIERGVIIAGRCSSKTNEYVKAINTLSWLAKYPYFVDALSGNRFVKYLTERNNHFELSSSESMLHHPVFEKMSPDVIIRFGDVPLSKQLNEYIAKSNPRFYIHVTDDDVWSDESHQINRVYHVNSSDFSSGIIEALKSERPNNEWFDKFSKSEKTTWNTIDHEVETGAYFDGAVVYDVVDLIPHESTLFVGNSLPVRHLDQFGKPQDKRIYTYANRGASGIDGNISTALGAGSARHDKPLVGIFGDITFYHDMNGLLAVHRCGVPITIVLINNDGGGIFNRLPIKDYEPEFTEYFITPHGLDFSHTAKLYGLDYIQIDAREGQREARTAFREAFSEVVGSAKSTIIEVRTDGKFDDARRREIISAVHRQLEAL